MRERERERESLEGGKIAAEEGKNYESGVEHLFHKRSEEYLKFWGIVLGKSVLWPLLDEDRLCCRGDWKVDG